MITQGRTCAGLIFRQDDERWPGELRGHIANDSRISRAYLPPDAAPRILKIVVSATTVYGGDTVSGYVRTSSNVASVELRVGGFSMPVPKSGVGQFQLTYKVPSLPFFLHRTYPMEIIARNTRGDRATAARASLHAQLRTVEVGSRDAVAIDFDGTTPDALRRLLIVVGGYTLGGFERSVTRALLQRGTCSLGDVLTVLASCAGAGVVHLFARWAPDDEMRRCLAVAGIRIVPHALRLEEAFLARLTVQEAECMDHQLTLAIALIWAISVLLWIGDLQHAASYLSHLLTELEDARELGRRLSGQARHRREIRQRTARDRLG